MARVPRATYRLQLHPGFTFRDAAAVVPYLSRLGVSHVYASPYLQARPGSTHGYDVTDYAELNPELGGEAGHAALVAALQAHGMGLILDFVPNHMGIGAANPWWQSVLEHGEASPFARRFDIDWRPPKLELHGKVLLPILGERYGETLDRGELRLAYDDGRFRIEYFDERLPIDPRTAGFVLREADAVAAAALSPGAVELAELRAITAEHAELRPGDVAGSDAAARRLAALCTRSRPLGAALLAALERLNGSPGDPRSFDRLDELLGHQPYRLASWRTAADEINYRRFFAINELAAIRQELPEVFAATHGLVLEQVAAGALDGLRIDHPDGLWDPLGYAAAVQQAVAELLPAERQSDGLPLYVVVEKILERDERLGDGWPVHGTTGYDFAALVDGLLVDASAQQVLDATFTAFCGELGPYAEVVDEAKRLILRTALASELSVLAAALNRISEQDRRTRDFTLASLADALREVIAAFGVYRTYVSCEAEPIAAHDEQTIRRAVARARRRSPAADPSVFDFVRDVLLLQHPDGLSEAARADRCRFVMKFQQLTGPVMAKGVEDCAFYRYARLVSLNEVGADPARFGVSPADFHAANAERRERWPHSMLAGSTHDTKRSEDVRARISVISELPRDWRAGANRWARLNRRHRRLVDGEPAPSRGDEYLLYQTMIGAWPLEPADAAGRETLVGRLQAYMRKASREAAVRTSWIRPDPEYESAGDEFVAAILDPERSAQFLAEFDAFVRRSTWFGALNSLAQVLLRLTAPGMPDIYQGCESWDFSLVDPDNRREVDFAARAAALEALQAAGDDLPERLVADLPHGLAKLHVVRAALAVRARNPDLFAAGDYRALAAEGPAANHVVAFLRRHRDASAISVVPRLLGRLLAGELATPLGKHWRGTSIPVPAASRPRQWRDALTGAVLDGDRLALDAVLGRFPVALLVAEPLA